MGTQAIMICLQPFVEIAIGFLIHLIAKTMRIPFRRNIFIELFGDLALIESGLRHDRPSARRSLNPFLIICSAICSFIAAKRGGVSPMVPGSAALALFGEVMAASGAAIAFPSFFGNRDHGRVRHQSMTSIHVLRPSMFGATVVDPARWSCRDSIAFFTSGQSHHFEVDF